jgi:hypothetical protein
VKLWLLTQTLNQVLRLAILKNILRKKKKDDDDDEPQQKLKHRLQQVVYYQRGDHLKEGTQIFILLSDQRKV